MGLKGSWVILLRTAIHLTAVVFGPVRPSDRAGVMGFGDSPATPTLGYYHFNAE
jgi:hypothetical protein